LGLRGEVVVEGGKSEVFEDVVDGFGGEAFAFGVGHAFAHFCGGVSI
jgi:hypothetical protein